MASSRKAEAARWFHQAAFDLKAARWNADGGFHDTACFVAHQTGEKGLKSLLYYLGARRAALLTHSLVQMIDEVLQQVPRLAGLLEQARHLGLHYVPSRYPNGLPSRYPHQFYSKEMSERATAAAEEIIGAVRVHHEQVGEGEASFSGLERMPRWPPTAG